MTTRFRHKSCVGIYLSSPLAQTPSTLVTITRQELNPNSVAAILAHRRMEEVDSTLFERERDRLTAEITSGFEELLSSSNGLNRKLEEVLGMTREYETIAALWQSFHDLMRGQQDEPSELSTEQPKGLPGTGGHVLTAKQGSVGATHQIDI
ncbi:uncharacterized protein FIBRA_03963 [Fibroporia radiculosa]|uniref:DASH complex subunit DAD1 n=1 Tax=Fibroporia radiculosa TaxID=599839 RepID=J4HW99_9APHY|nr:uncharacterized protein FIBRA_03963 [Fibroporia radiculosa]CCM01892.1 predicted protein [Fibroporia radiculosa]